jgi:signal transduction histidine kinase
VAFALVFTLIVLRLFFLYYKRHQKRSELLDVLEEKRVELEEHLVVERQKRQLAERRNLEQRAKISLVNGILPLIDRMLHNVRHLNDNAVNTTERLQYLRELTEKIDEQNNVLTHWIQLRQGELSLHVESFNLQSVFELIEKSRRSFSLAEINLNVEPTNLCVKADRVLTIFMLNTLADNARKFTAKGGEVNIRAAEEADYVEISVSDTGTGMDEQELAHVFEHKVRGGHGFGLLNCKGIIEKYKKTSQLFAVCKLGAESVKGQGSRFFFRLPKGIKRTLLLFLLLSPQQIYANTEATVFLQNAASFADSAYYSNIDGTYENTVNFADSCLQSLNLYYRQLHKDNNCDTLRLLSDDTPSIPDIIWLHSNIPLNYNILLSIRNECAIAALALHEWDLYHYNNRIYTTLFKELSADLTLDAYCRRMMQLQNNMMVAIVLLVLIVLALFAALLFQIIQAIGKRADRQQQQQEQLEFLGDELRRVEMEEDRLHVSNQVLENCLSTLKHETMYYPSRIRQLAENDGVGALPDVAGYYRELYGILSEQANHQVLKSKLHIEPLEHEVLGDRNFIDYLFEILRKQAGTKQLELTFTTKDEKYVRCEICMPKATASDFMPSIENIPYLLCRQIVREHGEATGLRACGIDIVNEDGKTKIIIILPRYVCRTSK